MGDDDQKMSQELTHMIINSKKFKAALVKICDRNSPEKNQEIAYKLNGEKVNSYLVAKFEKIYMALHWRRISNSDLPSRMFGRGESSLGIEATWSDILKNGDATLVKKSAGFVIDELPKGEVSDQFIAKLELKMNEICIKNKHLNGTAEDRINFAPQSRNVEQKRNYS